MIASNKAFDKLLVPAETVDGVCLSKKIIEKETRKVARKIESSYGIYNGEKSKVPLVATRLLSFHYRVRHGKEDRRTT